MKLVIGLWERILETDNLRLAFAKAAKGKWHRESVRWFSANLEVELSAMRRQLDEGSFPLGRCTSFRIFDPKERTIHAAVFPERVLHHAIMNVCEPVFERWLIDDSFACRTGRGRLAAIARAEQSARRNRWFLKMDVRKYFDNIDHDVLLAFIRRKFGDPVLLSLFARIVGAHSSGPGRGLPIGSLTSQHFANAYLGLADRFIKETLRCSAYVRYMDDMVVWAEDREELKRVRDAVKRFLRDELKLELKQEPCPQPTGRGMDFLGFRLFPGRTILSRQSRRRFVRKLRHHEDEWVEDRLSEAELQTKVTAMIAFVQEADSAAWRRRVFANLETGHRARTASTVAAAGTTTPPTAVRRTATGTTRATATTTWASALLSRPSSAWPARSGGLSG